MRVGGTRIRRGEKGGEGGGSGWTSHCPAAISSSSSPGCGPGLMLIAAG